MSPITDFGIWCIHIVQGFTGWVRALSFLESYECCWTACWTWCVQKNESLKPPKPNVRTCFLQVPRSNNLNLGISEMILSLRKPVALRSKEQLAPRISICGSRLLSNPVSCLGMWCWSCVISVLGYNGCLLPTKPLHQMCIQLLDFSYLARDAIYDTLLKIAVENSTPSKLQVWVAPMSDALTIWNENPKKPVRNSSIIPMMPFWGGMFLKNNNFGRLSAFLELNVQSNVLLHRCFMGKLGKCLM